jgi:hypothetical protein
MNDLTDKRVDRDHALGLQLPEKNVNRPRIRPGIMEAIIGKIDTSPMCIPVWRISSRTLEGRSLRRSSSC